MRQSNPTSQLPRRTARISTLLVRAGQAAAIAGAVVTGLSQSRADQVIWVARGTTDLSFQYDPIGAMSSSTAGFFEASADYSLNGFGFPNLMFPNTPGGRSGHYALATQPQADLMTDLVIGNDLAATRTVRFGQADQNLGWFGLPNARSLRITTQGDLTIHALESLATPFFNNGWLIRDPGCSGDHSINTRWFRWRNIWVDGAGCLKLNGYIQAVSAEPGPLLKMGPGTLIYDESVDTTGSPCVRPLVVHDGTLALRGNGQPHLLDAGPEPIRIGAEYGGADFPPGDIPPASWSPVEIPPVPPIKFPRAIFQADNIVAPDKIVRMGFNSVLRFEAPEPISFLGSATSDVGGTGTTIECNAQVLEAVSFGATALNNFLGTFNINGGIARLYGAPNAQIRFSLFAPTFPYQAMLEFAVPSGSYSFSNSISGFGRVSKYGPGTLNFSAATANFTGDFLLQDGTTLIPAGAAASTLRNAVTVSGPSAILSQQINTAIDPAATVKLDNSGTWRLNARSNVISQLSLVNNARVELGSGLVNVSSGSIQTVISPGFPNTATIAGPGTLSSSVPLVFDTSRGSSAADLDVQANLFAPSLTFTGSGSVRLSGPGAGAPPFTVQMGTVRLARTGASNTTGAATIGSASGPATDAALVLDASDQLPDASVVTLSNRASLDLNGFTDTIGGLVVSGAGPFTIGAGSGELVLSGNASFSGAGTTTITGPMNMLATSRSFTINTGATLTLSGPIYSGTIAKTGAGTLRLDNLDGSFTLNNGGATTVATTSTVGGLTGSGAIRIDTVLTDSVVAATQPAFGGALTGTGMFIKSGPGRQEFNSPVANTYTGGTRVEGGTLFLNRAPGNTVIPGNLTVASGGTVLFAGGASNQIADAADVTVESGGTMTMAGQSETVRSAVVSGTWSIDNPSGAQGNLAATQSLLVAGGTLDGTVSGGPLTINVGTAHLRGTIPSAFVGLNSTLAAGGFVGADQLTISGALSMTSNTSALKFTTGLGTDPALMRALGSLSYPFVGSVAVKVDQFIPQRVGTAIKLIDFGTGSSSPQLSRYALAAPAAGSGRGQLTLNSRVLSYVVTRNPCPADFDGSGTATVQDIFDFLSTWFAGTPGSDFNFSGTATVQDIFDFLAAWFQGCP